MYEKPWPRPTALAFTKPRLGQKPSQAKVLARLGPAFFGSAWPGLWPQAGAGTSLNISFPGFVWCSYVCKKKLTVDSWKADEFNVNDNPFEVRSIVLKWNLMVYYVCVSYSLMKRGRFLPSLKWVLCTSSFFANGSRQGPLQTWKLTSFTVDWSFKCT